MCVLTYLISWSRTDNIFTINFMQTDTIMSGIILVPKF